MADIKPRLQVSSVQRKTSPRAVPKPLLERVLLEEQTRETRGRWIAGNVRSCYASHRIVVIACLTAMVLVATAFTATNHPVAREPSDRGASLENAGIVKNQTAIVKATIGDPDYLDPAVDWETAGGEVIMNVYETLVWYDGEDPNSLIPVLATEVPSLSNGGISADGMNYTFNLKPNVTFHDTTTMDADDVEYSFERVLRIHDPYGPSWMMEQIMNDYIQYYVGGPLLDFKLDSYNAPWILDAIGGTADDYIITEIDVQNASEASVVKVDSDTVTVRLTHPYPGFLAIAAYTVMSIVSKDFVEAHGGVVNGEHNDYMDQHTCGTGPYMLASWDIGIAIHMTRWEGYHGTPAIQKDVHIFNEYDLAARIKMMQNGDADLAYIPIENESDFNSSPDFEVVKGEPTFSMDFIGFNLNINSTMAATLGSDVPYDFFRDKNVRKAFVHLFDSPLFITDYLKGNGKQPNGPIPMGMFGYNASAPVYDYSLTMASLYLQNAINPGTGRSWWADGFTLAFIYNAGNLLRETVCLQLLAALDALDKMPGKHGRFGATVNAFDWPTYLTYTRMNPSPLPVFFLGWYPDYADPDDYVYYFLHSSGVYAYRMSYSNATIDTLIEGAAMEMNVTLREQMYHEMTSLCYDDAPYIWVDQSFNFQIMRSWLNGYQFNPMFQGDYFPIMWKSNDPPDAVFDVQPPEGPVTTDFAFNASGSSDPNEDSSLLEIRWDWENDSVWDTGWTTNKTANHQYSSEGTYSVVMEIRDSVGLVNTTYGTVVVDNAIPEFSSALIPVLLIAAIVAVSRRIRTKRS